MSKTLVFVDWFLPGYRGGGPIQSVAGIVNLLTEKSKFTIITRNKDLNSPPYKNIKANIEVNHCKGTNVVYTNKLGYLSVIFRYIQSHKHNTIYFNSFFSIYFGILPLLIAVFLGFKGRIVCAPRGELLDERIAIKSRKKRTYIAIVKFLRIHRNIHWQATSEEEFIAIKKHFSDNVFFVPNISVEKKQIPIQLNKGTIRVVFYSRIVSYKNLDYAIETLAKMNAKFIFDIYGTIENKDYFEYCKERAALLNVKFSYCGELNHLMVHDKLATYDVFLFPTKGENFGHVIKESLQSGCIPLISDTTPWTEFVSDLSPAIALNDQDAFVKALNCLANLNYVDRHNLRIMAQNKIYQTDNRIASRKLYMDLLNI